MLPSKILLLCTLLSTIYSFYFRRQAPSTSQQLTAIPWAFAQCGDGDWTPEKLTLSATPKRNITVEIVMTGTANSAIDFKNTRLVVKLNGAYLHDETNDYTQSYDGGDTVEFKFQNFIPSFSPSGNYFLSFQFVDASGKNNGCFSFTFKL